MAAALFLCCLQYKDGVVGNAQLTVMTDRSQGGASLQDGQLEIMVSWISD